MSGFISKQHRREKEGTDCCNCMLQTYRSLRFCIGRRVEIQYDKKSTVVGSIVIVTPVFVVVQLEHYKVTRLISMIANKKCLFELQRIYRGNGDGDRS